MKIVVIGGAGRPGSKVITILKQNAPRALTAAQDTSVDPASDDCLPQEASVTRDVSKATHAGPQCRGKDCARCLSCPAFGRLRIADPETLGTHEAALPGTDRDPHRVIADPEALYFGVRLTDLWLLPDSRALQDATMLGGWLTPLPAPREK